MNESTELTITEEQALAQLSGMDLKPGGMEHVKPQDVAQPPRLRISAQNRPLVIGEKEIPVGHIANSLTGDEYGTMLEAVFLRFNNDTRVMWPETFSADGDPLCYSNDGTWPAEPTAGRNATNPQRGPCDSCPHSQFGPEGQAPRCKRQRNFLLWLPETEEPVLWTVQSTGLKPAKVLTNLAVSCNLRKTIVFTTHKESSDKGTWFVMHYVKGNPVDPRVSLSLYEIVKEYGDLDVSADVEQDVGVAPAQPDFEEEELLF